MSLSSRICHRNGKYLHVVLCVAVAVLEAILLAGHVRALKRPQEAQNMADAV